MEKLVLRNTGRRMREDGKSFMSEQDHEPFYLIGDIYAVARYIDNLEPKEEIKVIRGKIEERLRLLHGGIYTPHTWESLHLNLTYLVQDIEDRKDAVNNGVVKISEKNLDEILKEAEKLLAGQEGPSLYRNRFPWPFNQS